MKALTEFVEVYVDVVILAGLAIACLGLSITSGFAEARRSRRDNLDRVGFMPWRTLSILSLFAAAALAYLAYKDWMSG